jgi:hypothetical protein
MRSPAVPVYFFHIVEGDELIRDPEGVEQPDAAAARQAAIDGASALVTDAVKRGERSYGGRLDVEDERGGLVLTVAFRCDVNVEVTLSSTELNYGVSGSAS